MSFSKKLDVMLYDLFALSLNQEASLRRLENFESQVTEHKHILIDTCNKIRSGQGIDESSVINAITEGNNSIRKLENQVSQLQKTREDIKKGITDLKDYIEQFRDASQKELNKANTQLPLLYEEQVSLFVADRLLDKVQHSSTCVYAGKTISEQFKQEKETKDTDKKPCTCNLKELSSRLRTAREANNALVQAVEENKGKLQ